eukprot:789322_1
MLKKNCLCSWANLWFLFLILTLKIQSTLTFVLHPSFQSSGIRPFTQLFGETSDEKSYELKQYFATCIPGLAPILSEELINLGASNVEMSGPSGVSFQND